MTKIIPKFKMSKKLWIRVDHLPVRNIDRFVFYYFLDVSVDGINWTNHTTSSDYTNIAQSLTQITKTLKK